MPKWFDQAKEIERLRNENMRLLTLAEQLKARLGENGNDTDIYGVSEQERQLVNSGRDIEAVKAYRERTGADLVTAKKAINSVS